MATNFKNQQKNNSTNEEINNITNIAGQILRNVLQSNNITHIDLSEEHIGVEGIKIISKALEDNELITKINLCDNNVSSEGVSLLVKVLETNHSLTDIDL
ncbi:hypothetical protein [Candidatus Tisiphia endosymbiont of Mystacides longicornis]